MQKEFGIIFLFSLLTNFLFAQEIILKGSVVDASQKGVEGVSVIAHPIGKVNTLLGYAISDNKGEFEIKLPKKHQNLALTAMSLSYADKTVTVADVVRPIVMQLVAEVRKLKEVVVKALNIRMRGDTIIYTVGAFSKEKDRSIGDVIARMPGFEVTSSGAIEYQGKRIEKYYIEGLDLLEGRYGLANNNLPHRAVASVEVLENHQPVKMLDSLVFSDRTSLNIRLKNKIAVTGTAKLGLGVAPLLWEANVTPMFFSKKQQAIASYQANNIANNVGQQLQRFSFSGGRFQFQNAKKNLFSVLGVSVPNIGDNRYLDNNVHLLTYNHLMKIKKMELKINTSYLNDCQKQIGNNKIAYIQGKDTLHIVEQIHKRSFTNYLKTDFILNQNVKERYLKNKLSIQKYWDAETATLLGWNESKQTAKTPYFSVRNNLEWIQPFRNKFLKIRSNIKYGKAPQKLSISPSVFEKMLSKGQRKESVEQFWKERNFLTEHSLQFSLNKNQWSFDTEIGFNTEHNKKITHLEVDDIPLEQERFRNDLYWFFIKPYFKENIRYETSSFFLKIGMPLSWENYYISDKENSEKKKNLLLQPTLNITHKITPLLTWSINISYREKYIGMNSLYYGYILRSYRSISRRDIPLSSVKSWSNSLRVKYKNPISGFFASAQYWRYNKKKEAITQLKLNDNGSTEYNVLKKDNSALSNTVSLKTSKIIASWQTTFFLNAHYGWQRSESLFGKQLVENKYQNYEIVPKISFAYFDWFTLDYRYSFSKGKQKNSIMNSYTRNDMHSLQGSFYYESHLFSFIFDNYFVKTDKENYATSFFDISYNYHWKRKKIDFSLKCVNLLNSRSVESFRSSVFSEIISSYELRPRQILVSVRMSLGGK